MRNLGIVVVVLYAILAAGCAINPPVAMKKEFWTETNRSLGVAIAALPEGQLYKIGAQGLLDMAINESMTGELSTYLKNVNTVSYGKASGEIAKRFQERGFNIVEVDRVVNIKELDDFEASGSSGTYASKDFRHLKEELGVDRLVLITVDAIGAQRSYYGFIPTSDPVAMLKAHGEIIDLDTNELLWRQITNNTVAIDDPWDQPPEFTNVGVAVQKVILMARDQIIRSLFDGASSAPISTADAN